MAFIFGGSTGITPQQLAERRKIAEALAARAATAAPQNVGEGLSAIGLALASRIKNSRLDRQEATGRAAADEAFNSLFKSPDASPATLDAAANGPGGIGSDAAAAPRALDKYRNIIAAIESRGSGDYSALGPQTGGDRAYGRYQVMGANVGPWTKEALGQSLTPEQFIADPKAQDAVFNKIFGGYLQGNSPQDAASMWFTGRPQAQGGASSDVLGTTGNEYVSKFNALMGENGAGAGSMATGGAGPSVAGGAGLDPKLIQALSNPWMSDAQRSVLGALLQQQLAASAPKDPIKVGQGDTILDPKTYQPLYQAPPKPNEPPDKVQQYQFYVKQETDAGRPPKSFEEWSTTQSKAGATNIDLGDSSFAKEFGKQNAQNFFERRQGAVDAVASLKSSDEARKLLDSGVITGAGADWIVGAGKALQTMGFNVAEDPIANTEAFAATRAQEVGRIIKLFGAGTGLSDADREFAAKAAAGQITLNEKSIRRILDINDIAAKNVIELFNKDAGQIDPKLSPYPLQVEMPQIEQNQSAADAPPGTVFDSIDQIPEGATVDDNGVRKIKRNGQLVPVQ
jgi:hypothetical protein